MQDRDADVVAILAGLIPGPLGDESPETRREFLRMIRSAYRLA